MLPRKNLKRNITKFFQQPGYGLKVLVKRIKAAISYYFSSEKAPMPEAVTFFLTYKCNLRCKMCGQWGDKGVTRQKSEISGDMDFDVIKKIIDDISEFRPNITLFGGEPLLHRNIVDIVRYIKLRGMHCIIITNGLLLEKYASGLIEAGLDELNISIDGASRVHDEIRGVVGLFERIYHGIRKIVTERKGRFPLVNIQTTITKYNYKVLDELLDSAKEMGVDSITFHHLIYLNKNDIEETRKKFPFLNSREWEGFIAEPGILPEDLMDSLERIKKYRDRYPFSINVYPNFNNHEVEKYYSDNSWFPESYSGRCMSPWICAYVFPDAQLRPCLNFGYSFGDLNEKKFSEAWNGEAAQKFRLILKQEKMFPVCRRCTEIFRY